MMGDGRNGEREAWQALTAGGRGPTAITWRTLTSPGDDRAVTDIAPAPDGGFYLAGEEEKPDGPERNESLDRRTTAWVAHQSSAGELTWSQRFDPAADGRMDAVAATDDGLLVAGRRFLRVHRDTVAWVGALKEDGSVRWRTEIDYGEVNDRIRRLRPLEDGFVAAGAANKTYERGRETINVTDGLLVRFGSDGTAQWAETFFGHQCMDLSVAGDGSVRCVQDPRVFAVSPSGTERWSQYGDSDHDSFESVPTCGSQTFAVGTKRGDCDPSRAWVLVLDEDGERVRDRTYVIGSTQNVGTALVSDGDGYLLAGGVFEVGYGELPWLARLDADGDVEWTRLLAVRDGQPELLTGRPAAHLPPESDPELTRLVETGGGVALLFTAGDRSWLGLLD